MMRHPSPSMASNAGMKRKERDFEHDQGEETNIHVVVRCRGRSEREVKENSGVVVSTTGVKGKHVELSMGPNALSNKTYHFDKVFSPAADQAILFEDVVAPTLTEMLAGYNCTVFAYGQTGTGKTYTMSGDMTDTMGLLSDAAGIIPRVLYSLFQKLEAEDTECSVKCSFIELYNEELRDLLSADDNTKLKIYEDGNKKGNHATFVQGMEESHIKTANAGVKLLQAGSHRRQVAATKCNDLSSRSHTVFTITTYLKKTAETGEDFICAGKLNLVDLAGSENIQRSGAENKRAAEAGLINKSLLTLGRVINALVDKSSHIPYRESKLTRLLQDSLGGQTKTCIIATISPAKSNLEETISTLDYAFRAKNIRNKPQINSMVSKKTLLKEFTAEIEKLKGELIATRQRNGVYLTNEQYEEMTVESESRRILSEEQKARIETLETSLRNKVQELFVLTSNFKTLKTENSHIKQRLDNTQDLLEKTEIVLKDTKQSLTDEAAVREAHQHTENELHELGSGLVSTLTETVGDLGGLHAKLRRRSELQALNRSTWDTSTREVVDITRLMDSKVENFQAEHEKHITELSSRIEDFVAAEISNFAQSQTLLATGAEKLDGAKQEADSHSSSARDEMNTVLEEIKDLRDNVQKEVGNGLNGLSAAAARISGEVISELEQFHSQLHSSYSSLGKEFKSIFEDISKHMTAQRKEADQLRQQLQEANKKNLEASQAAASQLSETCETEREASRLDRQNLLAQIQSLIESSAKTQEDRLTKSLTTTATDLTSSTTALETATSSYSTSMDAWLAKEASFADTISSSRDALKSKLKKDWQSVNERNSAIQSSTKTIHEETVLIVDAQIQDTATQMSALDNFVTRARAQNDEHSTSHAADLDALSSTAKHAFNDLSAQLTASSSHTSSFASQAKEETSSLTHASLIPFTTSLRQPLSDLESNIQSAHMTEYVPTGTTPQKREWDYPKHLPRTEERETLLKRLRGGGAEEPSTMTPGRSPNKRLKAYSSSPRKSPSKSRIAAPAPGSPSKSKTRVYTDANAGLTSNPHSSPVLSKSKPTSAPDSAGGGGLREIDINVIGAAAARPPLTSSSTSIDAIKSDEAAPAESAPTSVFSKSVGAMPPGMRRLNTDGGGVTKLPTKKAGGGAFFAQSLGAGERAMGRRLRGRNAGGGNED
ncbi:MAG: hypothetical protein Q9160_000292 [Pyrenula sp. 1 TL-2023]